MSDILWQTFNNTYTNSIRKVSFNNYSDKVSFNNYSDKHFWKMIYNIFTQIMKDIWWTNFTFTSQHSLHNIHQNLGMILQQTFHPSCITYFHKSFATNWVTDISSHTSSQHLFQHSFNFNIFIIINWMTDISQHSSS